MDFVPSCPTKVIVSEGKNGGKKSKNEGKKKNERKKKKEKEKNE